MSTHPNTKSNLTNPSLPNHKRVTSASSVFIPKPRHKRPLTSLSDLNKMNIFRNKKDSKLDVLNLIIETNPSKYNLNKLGKKIREINPIYSATSASSHYTSATSFPSLLNKKTEEVYYKYNVLYGSNTTNLIRTYSPKMRPMSASISSFTKNMKLGTNEEDVFTSEEVTALTKAKCADLNIELREKMTYKFNEYCKSKCKNRMVDFTECNMGIYCTRIIADILFNSERIARLNLTKNNIGDKGVEIIANAIRDSTSLISLNVTSNSITYKGGRKLMNVLIVQTSLIDVNISSKEGINRNRISFEGLAEIEEVLSKNPYIEFLNLSSNSIKNEGLKLIVSGLNHNSTLHSLDVSHNDINSAGIITALDKVKLSKLIELNLSGNPIGNEGLIKLTESLKNFQVLKKLNLSSCQIEFKGASYLLMDLQNKKRIDSVNLSGNDIRSERFEQIKPFFSVFGIKYLNLSRCSLGNQCTFILGECLMINESIKRIDISDNKISDKGFKSFVPLLSKNNVIESFDASKNFITDVTAKDFISNIKYNRALKSLNLYDNQLKNESGTVLVELLITNKNLKYINVGFNRIQMKLIEEINRRLKMNAQKQKSKFLPNLIKEIKSLETDPEEFVNLEAKIKQEKINYHLLEAKLKEDNEQFPKMKIEEKKKVEDLIAQNIQLQSEIEKINSALAQVALEIKKAKTALTYKSHDLENKIENEQEEIEKLIKVKEGLLIEQSKNKTSYDCEIASVMNKAKLSKEKVDLAEISLKSLTYDLNKKKAKIKK